MLSLHPLFRMIPAREASLRMKFKKGILPLFLVVSLAFPFVPAAHAAMTPSLGTAATYGILASTYTNTTAGTVINGDVGFTTGPAVAPAGVHALYGSGAPYPLAGFDQGNALTALDAQLCTFTFAPGAINLSTDTSHGPLGVYTPGVYCSLGAMNIGGPLLLSGNGTFIFRSGGALTSTAGAIVTLAGACVNDVFWTPTQATTLAANTTFVGTVIDDAGITVGANTTWTGRALSFGETVTTDTDTITVPTTCAVAPASSAPGSVSSSSSVTSSVAPASSASSSQLSSSMQASSAKSSSSVRSSRSSSAASSVASSARPMILPPAAVFTPPPEPTPEVQLMPVTGVDYDAAGNSLKVIAFCVALALSFSFMLLLAKRLSSFKK